MTIAVVAFFLGLFVGAVVTAAHAHGAGVGGKQEALRPKIGSRWNFRGHIGDVIEIRRNRLLFHHERGGHQVVPLAYFTTAAEHLWSPSEEKKP